MATVHRQPASGRDATEQRQRSQEEPNGKGAPAAMSGLYRAVTGAIYLFKDQAEPIMHPELLRVPLPVEGTVARPLSEQVSAVQRAFPDDGVVSVVEPLGPGRSTAVFVNLERVGT